MEPQDFGGVAQGARFERGEELELPVRGLSAEGIAQDLESSQEG